MSASIWVFSSLAMRSYACLAAMACSERLSIPSSSSSSAFSSRARTASICSSTGQMGQIKLHTGFPSVWPLVSSCSVWCLHISAPTVSGCSSILGKASVSSCPSTLDDSNGSSVASAPGRTLSALCLSSSMSGSSRISSSAADTSIIFALSSTTQSATLTALRQK